MDGQWELSEVIMMNEKFILVTPENVDGVMNATISPHATLRLETVMVTLPNGLQMEVAAALAHLFQQQA